LGGRNKQASIKEKIMSMLLQCKETSKPHPEGIYSGVCVDVVDLGLVETEFQGERKLVPKLRLFFETEYRDEAGKAGLISKTFTASLHQKARLSEYIGKWRGRPVVPGESVDLGKLVGACCTLVISHQQNMVGRTYAAIDALSKPTKKVAASGQYDPAETRRRIAEWREKEGKGLQTTDYGQKGGDHGPKTIDHRPQTSGPRTTDNGPQGSGQRLEGQGSKTGDCRPEEGGQRTLDHGQQAPAEPEFDSEVGF
jgi:hypothetical protein